MWIVRRRVIRRGMTRAGGAVQVEDELNSPDCDAELAVVLWVNLPETVAVVPEGVMLNYLLRVESPLRVLTLMPPEILTFGESATTDALRSSPPTYVVYVHKDTAEYGYPLFGTSPQYGERTIAWISSSYDVVRTFGREPRSSSGDGIEILKLASHTPRTAPHIR